LSLDEHIDNYNNYKNDNEDEGELDYAFGHMLIYQLIRFWDSRYYMGKFLEEYDAPRSNLQLTFVNENGLKQYMKSYQIIKDCIKNELMDMEQWNLFQQYIVEYNGQSLFHDNVNEFKKQWNKYNISSLIDILKKIATQEEVIIEHLKRMRDSLVIEENGEDCRF